MKTKEEYIAILLLHTDEIKSTFGVKSLRLFGSVSRDENHENSLAPPVSSVSPGKAGALSKVMKIF